nr:hypothetical protein [Rahnella sp. WMR42]
MTKTGRTSQKRRCSAGAESTTSPPLAGSPVPVLTFLKISSYLLQWSPNSGITTRTDSTRGLSCLMLRGSRSEGLLWGYQRGAERNGERSRDLLRGREALAKPQARQW